MKKIVSLAIVLLLTVFSVIPAFAYQVSEDSTLGQFRKGAGSVITEDDYVLDLADLLSDGQERALYDTAVQLASDYSCGVYILTVPDMYSFGYTYVESFSEDWYDTMELGRGGSRNGILLVLSMAGRDYDICAYGNFANTAFTDYGKDVMADRFLPYFRNGDWYGGFASYIETCGIFLDRAWRGDPFDVGDSLLSFSERFSNALSQAVPISAIISFVVILAMKRKMNNARQAATAGQYVVPGSIVLDQRYDRFSHVTETRTPRSTSKGGGGGTSIGSSGHSHHSGKF